MRPPVPTYSADGFDPAAPVALVSLRDPESGASLDAIAMLIDSGADITEVPRSAVDRLGVSLTSGVRFEVSGFDGSRSLAGAVTLELRLLGHIFRGQFLVADLACGILGRKVLNSLSLLLDGPSLRWDIASPQ